MKTPKEIGFKMGWIYEVLVENAGGHAAPMGVWTDDGVRLKLSVYNTSATCAKIKKDREFRVFFPKDWFAMCRCLKTKKLGGSDAGGHLDCAVVAKECDELRTTFTCEVTGGNAKEVRLLNRAEGLFAEFLIESTKPGNSRENLRRYCEKIKKVATESDYEKEAEKIMRGQP